jgi:hypothetical protein
LQDLEPAGEALTPGSLFTLPSISSHSRLNWLLETPLAPIALTSSTARVEMPCT